MVRRVLANLALLAVAAGVSIALGEIVLRIALDEVDYLAPRLVSHPVLGHAIAPGSAGHDAWGFRNRGIPRHARWVAIGDSQTYGVSAPANQSWPAHLARKLGEPVYNLALGGYGPDDYAYLLREYAPQLDPETVIVGFYFGNDLIRATQIAGSAYAAVTFPTENDPRLLGKQRTWLSRSSMLYQVVKFELPAFSNFLRGAEAAAGSGIPGIRFEHRVSGTILTPSPRIEALDPEIPRNQLGLEATKAAFLEIDRICRERMMTCFALLIPTKESVYASAAKETLAAEDRAEIERLVREETRLHETLTKFLADTGLAVIDPLPALRDAVLTQRLYAAHHDGHPNGAGYAVIAESVFDALAASSTAP